MAPFNRSSFSLFGYSRPGKSLSVDMDSLSYRHVRMYGRNNLGNVPYVG